MRCTAACGDIMVSWERVMNFAAGHLPPAPKCYGRSRNIATGPVGDSSAACTKCYGRSRNMQLDLSVIHLPPAPKCYGRRRNMATGPVGDSAAACTQMLRSEEEHCNWTCRWFSCRLHPNVTVGGGTWQHGRSLGQFWSSIEEIELSKMQWT